MADFTVLGLCGSLRRASYNMAALRAARELAPEGMEIELADLSEFPLYDDDVRQAGFPPAVTAVREAVRRADALLFACPEYNYSISGVLKNAVDWISRPPDQPFAGKAAAVFGASSGVNGTTRAQYHLRQVGVGVDLKFLNRPEVFIASAAERFDSEGRLTHEKTRELIRLQLGNLRDWARQLRK
jgi:chromate reductase, NAD(P)H dehydrogenase (quinone)